MITKLMPKYTTVLHTVGWSTFSQKLYHSKNNNKQEFNMVWHILSMSM